MKRIFVWAWCVVTLFGSWIPAVGAGFDAIIRESRQVQELSADAQKATTRLRAEVDKIMKAGHLMPFRVQYGEGRPRNLYAEPWMMMFTLARAYPYLGRDTQSAITNYLHQEMQLCPPWSRTALGPVGTYRQGDPKGVPEMGLPPKYKPTGTMFYALWLYAQNTGDGDTIKEQWNELKTLYGEVRASPANYELISGAIAMTRLARIFGDEPASQRFASEAAELMQAGTNFESFRRNAHVSYSGKPNWYRGSDGIAFALFYLTPEVARYINQSPELKRAMDSYADQAAAVWPLWWMAQAPIGDWGYFDEGSCAGPETRMMLFNYFAWVRQKPATELNLLADVPDALVGDCYYLQNLVTAIEACGRCEWR